MKNIKTMKFLGTALFIFACLIAVLRLSIYFLSDDKNDVESIQAQHVIYQSIGELVGLSSVEGATVKAISVLNDNINNPDVETIVNCYTNTSAAVFRDHLRAVNFSKGQFCKVQQNLQATSSSPSNQNVNDRCTEPKSIIMSSAELEKRGRQYTGDFATDLAHCKQ